MLVVGRFGAAFGVRGWIRVTSFTVPPQNILDYRPWHIENESGWQPLEIDAARAHQKGFVAHIQGLDDRNEIEKLKGRQVGVPESVLPDPEPDEYYWKDLVGLSVVDTEGAALGTVSGLMETGVHDVLVVDGDAGEVLIPFVRAVVTEVDPIEGRLVVDWQTDF